MTPMRIIYENKRPKFAIGLDRYQWILCQHQKKRGEWVDKTYHPNLCNLLDELAESIFKRNAKKLNELKDLEQIVERVYVLNEKIVGRLEKQVGGGGRGTLRREFKNKDDR